MTSKTRTSSPAAEHACSAMGPASSGALQENYGYTHQKAMEEADRWIENMNRGGKDSMGNP